MSLVRERPPLRSEFPEWVADSSATNIGQDYTIVLLQEDRRRNRPMVDSVLGLLDAYGICLGGMTDSTSVAPPHVPLGERRRALPDLARLSPRDLIKYISKSLSFGKSDIARVLHVSRQAVYDWIGGTAPSPENERRLLQIARIASEFVSSTGVPIMRRFVIELSANWSRALSDMLEEDPWDEDRLQSALAEARARTTERKGSRPSAWLRSLGFPEQVQRPRPPTWTTTSRWMTWKRS